MEKDEDRIKAQLTRVVDGLAKMLPDASRVSADLWKFAKVHDRRNYQLIRFAMAAVSDYRTVTKAIRELAKRIQNTNSAAMLDTLTPLIYRCSSLVYNRSHIPGIMELSRTDEKGLANTAHELLKEISTRNPEVLEAHVQEMCADLQAQAPDSKSTDDAGAEEILKACSGFAKKLPSKLPKERKFLLALTNYALYSSSPRAAKHAVSIIMAAADKKEMYAKDLVQQCVKDWTYGSDHFITRLATISQLNLLAPREADEESDAIISIAVNQILLTNRSPQTSSGYTWSEEPDEEAVAKEWALKIIVNRLRAKDGSDNEDDFRAHAERVYGILNQLVANEGEMSKDKDTPASQKSRLRLLAAKLLLKLCSSQSLCEQMLTPKDFNVLALVAQDPLLAVRRGFITQLKKKLVQNTSLTARWYTIPCLLAFEPSVELKDSTLTWLRSRANFFSRQAQVNGKRSEQQTVMESIFSRLLSLLAYHPDYPSSDLDESTRVADLADFARYILFYLSAVANENNISLIFHIAQRVKQTRDGITKSDEITTRLHTLSDLAQATIRRFADIYSQQHKFGGASGGTNILQTYPGKMRLPSSIFAPMTNHQEAQEVAEKNFLPDDIDDLIDRIVRHWMKPKSTSHAPNHAKKRKSEADTNGDANAVKKFKKDKDNSKALPIRKSSSSAGGNAKVLKKNNKKKDDDEWGSDDGGAGGEDVPSTAARRRSSRGASRKEVSYVDPDSDEDDFEMDEWDQGDEPEEEAEEDGAEKQDEDGEEKAAEEQGQESEPGGGENGEEKMEDVAEPEPEAEASSPPAKEEKQSTTARGKKAKEQPNSKGKSSSVDKASKKTEAVPTRRSTRRG